MKLFFFLLVFLASSLLFSQKENPYFQQKVDYEIHVKLNDKTHEISAFETIKYTNNSAITLESIYFHLWPNAYKNHATSLGKQLIENDNTSLYYAPKKTLGYIDSLDFKTNDQKLKWRIDSIHEDICNVTLLKALHPGETVEITTPFRVKIPKGIYSRLGHIGQSYQLTQWFPKPAVFDKNGWHQMPYLDQGEFYSEYGTFDVFITLPKNYVVGATGDLINGEQEIEWLTKKAENTSKIKTYDLNNMSFPTSSDSTKTLHYHQKKIHDFAWFTDKRYNVLKGEVTLPHSKNKVTSWAMFTNNEADLWHNSIEYLNDATYYYSLWNGDYPYKQVTAVDGTVSAGGGMEYPNVTIIGESYDAFTLETTIMHEVGHNWFYGILGTNEREHGWMDEGLNSMTENRYIETKYPNRRLFGDAASKPKIAKLFDIVQYKHKANHELSYLINARRNKDQSIETHSNKYTSLNYGGIVYSKTALVFDYLKAYLGGKVFDKCMQKYFEEWKFKHPEPKDLRKIFEEETNKDLNWFFDDLIKTRKKIDYKITGSKKDTTNKQQIILKIKNKGEIHSPFSISGIKDGITIHTRWYEPIDKKQHVSFQKGDYDNYRIDAQLNMPEINRKNNTLKAKGLFKTTEPFRLQLLGSLENPDKTQLFFSPIAGWNINDMSMLGIAFYNSILPSKKFEYDLAPLYSFNTNNINGYASAFYHIYPNSIFTDITIGASAKSFTYRNIRAEASEYFKLKPEITFHFKKKRARQFSSSSLVFKNYNIYNHDSINDRGGYRITKNLNHFYVNSLLYSIKNTHPINPFDIKIELQQASAFLKLNLTANYHLAYKKNKTGFDVRFFAGQFLNNSNTKLNSRYNYNLSGDEPSDYLYNEIFIARNTSQTFLNQQTSITDGGFKNLAIAKKENNFISSNKWLFATNLKSNVFSKHLSIYADFGFVGSQKNGNSDIAYNFGIALNILPNIFEVYFPIKTSSDFNLLSYNEKIRFILNLNALNPFKKIREFEL